MREGIHVRYVGEGVRDVPGVGVFQKGTVAWVKRDLALDLLKEDCFVAEGSGRPVKALVLRIGQSGPETAERARPPEISPEDLKRRLDAGEPTCLIDVRQPWEHETAAIAGSVLIPLPDLPATTDVAPPEGALVVVYCHHGVRSLSGAAHLLARGWPSVASLAGGIDAWSERVDPGVPRY